jgi:hypothetical protein
MIYRFSFVLFVFLFACDKEQPATCFHLTNNLNSSSFINRSHRSLTDKIFFPDDSKVALPNQEKYNYLLHSNFIEEDSFYVNRIEKDKMNEYYNYCILVVEKSSKFKISDSICLQGSIHSNKYISSSSLSNDKAKLALIYSSGNLSSNNKCSLEIKDLNNNKIILNIKYNDRFFLEQNPWASNNEHIVLYNTLKEIFVLDIKTNELKKISSSGSRAMWLQSLNKIAYLKERNVIAVYDLMSSSEEIYEIQDKLFYKNSISDYYWFATQKKFYIKTRFSNLLGDKLVPWKNENYILEYECLKGD